MMFVSCIHVQSHPSQYGLGMKSLCALAEVSSSIIKAHHAVFLPLITLLCSGGAGAVAGAPGAAYA